MTGRRTASNAPPAGGGSDVDRCASAGPRSSGGVGRTSPNPSSRNGRGSAPTTQVSNAGPGSGPGSGPEFGPGSGADGDGRSEGPRSGRGPGRPEESDRSARGDAAGDSSDEQPREAGAEGRGARPPRPSPWPPRTVRAPVRRRSPAGLAEHRREEPQHQCRPRQVGEHRRLQPAGRPALQPPQRPHGPGGEDERRVPGRDRREHVDRRRSSRPAARRNAA